VLGHFGLMVSVLTMGTMTFGGKAASPRLARPTWKKGVVR